MVLLNSFRLLNLLYPFAKITIYSKSKHSLALFKESDI